VAMDKAEKVQQLCVKRGFFWGAYEIYGGVAGFLTWGPNGVILKRRIADYWRKFFIDKHGFVEISSPDIAPYIVFEASGHVEGFKDIMVTCLKCNNKYRADTLLNEKGINVSEALGPAEMLSIIDEHKVKCPNCGGELGEPGYFITMFQTTIGPYAGSKGFLRPETAQGMFTEFKRVFEAERKKFPIGIAQVGRGYRNEISPRQGPIRLREFDMMELEMFIDPQDQRCPYFDSVKDEELNLYHRIIKEKGELEYETMSAEEAVDKKIIINEWMAYFMVMAQKFMETLGIPRNRQRFHEKLEGERAHYATQTFDQEVYLSRWGWIEVSGHAYRGDYDLLSHIKTSGRDLYVDRKLDKPKKVIQTTIIPDPKKIKDKYPRQIGRIMKFLREEDSWKEELVDKGYINITDEITLDKSFFNIKTEEKKIWVEKFIPHVVEPSFGLDRIAYTVLEYSYTEKEDRVVLSLPYIVRVFDCAVFPLVDSGEFNMIARSLYNELIDAGFRVIFEAKDSIGRRYARIDEIGVPVAFTIDGRTLEDSTVTVRDRDTWRQYRLKISDALVFLRELFRYNSFTKVVKMMKLESVD